MASRSSHRTLRLAGASKALANIPLPIVRVQVISKHSYRSALRGCNPALSTAGSRSGWCRLYRIVMTSVLDEAKLLSYL